MDKETLAKFSGGYSGNWDIKVPWSLGAYTYATNGAIAIKVPRLGGVPENPKSPDVDALKTVEPKEWYPAENIKMPRWRKCTECESYDGQCEECGGMGKTVSQKPKLFHGTIFDQKYLALISSLPNSEIGVIPEPGVTLFRFDGGTGLLMPIRTQ